MKGLLMSVSLRNVLTVIGVLCLIMCHCTEKGDGVGGLQPNPGLVDVFLRDADGSELPDVSVGAIMLQCTGIALGEKETELENHHYPWHQLKKADLGYRLLIIADESQCHSDRVCCLHVDDRTTVGAADVDIVALCSGANMPLDPDDFQVDLVLR